MPRSRRALLRALLVTPFAATCARADAGWDGTWVAADRRHVLQVIVAGGEAVGLFWGGDYRTPRRTLRDASGALTVVWDAGRVVLSGRAGGHATATIEVIGRPLLKMQVRLD